MKFTILLSLFFFVLIFVQTCFSAYKAATTFEPDFSIFYKSSQDVIKHTSPYTDKHLYTAFNYPLITAILFVPLTFVSFQSAQVLFTVINLFCTFAIIFLSIRLSQQKITLVYFSFLSSLAFLFFPAKFTIGMGQINLIAFAFLLSGFYCFKQHKYIAFIFFLLSVICKPILGFVFTIFIFQKEYKYFLSLLLGAITFLTVLPEFIQVSSTRVLFSQIMHEQSYAGRDIYYNQGVSGFVSRLVENLFIRKVFSEIISITIALFGLLQLHKRSLVEQLSILLIVLVMIDPLSWQHHFVFLLFPIIFLFFTFLNAKKIFPLTFLAICYALVGVNIKTPVVFSAFPANLLLSHELYGAVGLLALQLVSRKQT